MTPKQTEILLHIIALMERAEWRKGEYQQCLIYINQFIKEMEK